LIGSNAEWLRRGARDWRVWALWLFLQAPGFRVLAKFLPSSLRPAIPVWLVGVWLLYSALLHHEGLRVWCRRAAARRILGAIVIALALFNAAVYPRVDARKAQMLGSDEDDNLIQTSVRLVTGQRPLYVHNYFGNAPTQGPGWALMVTPLTLTGAYFLLTPLAYGALPLVVAAAGGSGLAAAIAAIVPLTSPAFWELLVTGSDLFAIGVLFVALTAALHQWRRTAVSTAICLGLTAAAATSRFIFAFPAALAGSFLWRRDRLGGALFVTASVMIVLIEWAAWWPDTADATPISLVGKGIFMLGPLGVRLGAIAAVAATAIAIWLADRRVESWMRSGWLALAVVLGAIAIAELGDPDFDFQSWRAATYPMVAAPLLVATVALTES
jgi:hypothetical protein